MNVLDSLMKTKKFWDFYARFYDVLKTFPPYINLQDKVIDSLELIPNLVILDAGCGTGNMEERLRGLSGSYPGMKIVAIDTSPSMLRRAAKKMTGVSDVKLQKRSFDDLDGLDRVDRLIAVHTLYASQNVSKTFQNWQKILEDGGLLVIVNPIIPKQLYFREFFQGLWKKRDIRGLLGFLRRLPRWGLLILTNSRIAKKARKNNFHFLQPDELRIIAEQVGFKILKQEIVYGGCSVIMSFQKETSALISRAQRPKEIEQTYGLRYNEYCFHMKSFSPTDYSENKESDLFDSHAFHFVAREQVSQKIIGSLRLLVDSGRGFLLEQGSTIKLPAVLETKRRITMEISRWVVIEEYRGRGIGAALVAEAIKWSYSRGYRYWIMMSQKNAWDVLNKNGLQTELWGEFREYHNTISAPGSIYLSL